MKIVYIAGPYTGDGSRKQITENIKEASKYQVALINKGVGALCPHMHTSHLDQKGAKVEEDFYYNLDMELLKRAADGLLAMPSWKSSTGACREVNWAEKSDIPVFYPQSSDDLSEILNWAHS